MTSTEIPHAQPGPLGRCLVQTLYADACLLLQDRDGDGFIPPAAEDGPGIMMEAREDLLYTTAL